MLHKKNKRIFLVTNTACELRFNFVTAFPLYHIQQLKYDMDFYSYSYIRVHEYEQLLCDTRKDGYLGKEF